MQKILVLFLFSIAFLSFSSAGLTKQKLFGKWCLSPTDKQKTSSEIWIDANFIFFADRNIPFVAPYKISGDTLLATSWPPMLFNSFSNNRCNGNFITIPGKLGAPFVLKRIAKDLPKIQNTGEYIQTSLQQIKSRK